MLKSCRYCGRIHDPRDKCAAYIRRRRERFGRYDAEKRTVEQRFRATEAWKRKSIEIRQRDNYLCQACIRGLTGTRRRLEFDDVSVHHAVSLKQDYDKRLDNDNLISLCKVHHELAECGKISLEAIQGIIREQEEKSIPPSMYSKI